MESQVGEVEAWGMGHGAQGMGHRAQGTGMQVFIPVLSYQWLKDVKIS